MSEYVYAGLTSQTLDIFLQDSSSSTGQGLSGLVFNSASLIASYRKGATGSRTAITLATQTVAGAYSSGGFVEIDATNMKGVYRLDIPNAAVDTEGFVTLYLYGATNLLPTALRIDCRPLPVDVKRFGGTALTAAAGIPEVKVASIAANAVNASALATDAVAEIQSSLASQASVDTIQSDTNDIQTRLPAALESGRIAAVLDSAAILAVADQVWDEATSGHTTAGTYGGRIVRATNSNTEVQITGSNHIAADIHNLQSGVITAGDFAANSITASALATDAVTEIQSGLATAAALATESTKINRIEAVATGTVTGAGTSTEVFVGPSATLTITVDSSGNRSAVVVT